MGPCLLMLCEHTNCLRANVYQTAPHHVSSSATTLHRCGVSIALVQPVLAQIVTLTGVVAHRTAL